MKKLAALSLLLISIYSCGKMACHHPRPPHDNPCPEVVSDSVPTPTLSRFQKTYPEATGTVWYNREGESYVAVFTNNGLKTKAAFDASGNIVKKMCGTEIEEDHNDGICDCEMGSPEEHHEGDFEHDGEHEHDGKCGHHHGLHCEKHHD